jgi:hypothetical protein
MRVGRRTGAAGLALATATLGGGLALLTAPPASAAGQTRIVATDGTDTGNCTVDPCLTIQYAVDQATAGDTVQVGGGTFAEGVLIRKSLTIDGNGASGAGRTTISGPADGSAPSVTISSIEVPAQLSVTIENVDVSGNLGNVGISDEDGNLTVRDSVVADNNLQGLRIDGTDAPEVTIDSTTVSGNQQQGIELDSESDPALTVTNSTVTGNGPGGEGGYGGIEAFGGSVSISSSTISKNGFSGVYVEAPTDPVTITDSTLDGNGGSGLEIYNASVTVTRSTVSNSVATGQADDLAGAGVIAYGGASVTIDTSTIAGNSTWGAMFEGATGTLSNSTVSGTGKGPGGELPAPAAAVATTGGLQLTAMTRTGTRSPRQAPRSSVKPAVSAPPVALSGTVIAQNSVPDCSGTFADNGYNLADDASCVFNAAGSVNKGTAKLGPLADNGGPTRTLLPAKGSDAIDAIPSGSAGCSAKGTDQRGDARLAGPRCDMGAVEVAQPPIVITPPSLPDGTVGKAYRVTLGATGGLGAPYAWSLANGSALPAGLTLSSGGVLSGTPTVAGTFTFTVSVDDPTTKTYRLIILAPPTPTASHSQAALAATGSDVGPQALLGAGLLGVGLLFVGLGLRRRGRHA